jgi:cyclin B
MHSVDMADRLNPQAAAEYAHDIFNYHRQVEGRYAPSATYMSRQSDINERMRAILIDWLVEVHLKFKLEKDTLFLTVHLIDRLLQLKAVKRQKLQLVGVTAMLIASKYEEIYAPEVRDFVYISDNAYTNDEILAMEALMLNAFQFRITTPSILSFLSRFTKIMGADSTVSRLSQYFAESMLQEYSMLRYPASTIAAASVAVARKTIGKTYWNANLEKLGQYTEQDLAPCISEIIELMKPENGSGRKSNLQAVKKKFSSARFGEVALLTIPVNY